jgi:uncharacterized protein (TIGR03437 family)
MLVGGASGAAPPTGSISYTIDGGAAQTAVLGNGTTSVAIAGLAIGAHTVLISYGGDVNYLATASQPLAQALTVQQAPPAINAAGVTSAAGTGASVSPGGLMTIYGANLQASTSAGPAGAPAVPLLVALGGTQVLVNNRPAPLLYVSAGQINLQAPYETPVGTPVPVIVIANGVSSSPALVTFSFYAPNVFTYPRTASSTDPIITHANNTLITPSSPAQPGEVVVIWGTGAGELNNQPLDGAGAPATPPATTADTPFVTIGGREAAVQFSGLTPAYVGLLQINVQLPATLPAGNGTPASLPLVITFPGAVSAPVNLWVSQ